MKELRDLTYLTSERFPPHQAVERSPLPERELFIDNLLVRIHFIIVMIRWTGLVPWEFEFPFPGSLTCFLALLPYLSFQSGLRLCWRRSQE